MNHQWQCISRRQLLSTMVMGISCCVSPKARILSRWGEAQKELVHKSVFKTGRNSPLYYVCRDSEGENHVEGQCCKAETISFSCGKELFLPLWSVEQCKKCWRNGPRKNSAYKEKEKWKLLEKNFKQCFSRTDSQRDETVLSWMSYFTLEKKNSGEFSPRWSFQRDFTKFQMMWTMDKQRD